MSTSIKIKKENIKQTRILDRALCIITNLKPGKIMTIEQAVSQNLENSTFFNIKKLKGETIEISPLPVICQAYKICEALQSLSKSMPKPKKADKFISNGSLFAI